MLSGSLGQVVGRVLAAGVVATVLVAGPAIAASPYTVRKDGAVGVKGKAKFSSGEIHFNDTGGPLSCSPTGTYRYTKTSSSVRFTKVSDPCAGRATVLTIGTFKK
jgi:hypothetical protein